MSGTRTSPFSNEHNGTKYTLGIIEVGISGGDRPTTTWHFSSVKSIAIEGNHVTLAELDPDRKLSHNAELKDIIALIHGYIDKSKK